MPLKGEILDGLFTGRLNGTKAALSGRLSFSGDTIKAISLKRIQKDLNRLYMTAREQTGDPCAGGVPTEDLEPAAALIEAASVRARTASGPRDLRDEVIEVVDELFEEKLITSTGGNVSVRIPGHADELWITPSRLHKGSLHRDLMVRMDLAGDSLDPDLPLPSSERHVHVQILRARPDIGAVIHTHAPYATVLVLAELPFLPISTEAAFVGEIARVPFIMPGSEELASRVVDALGDGTAVLMQNHGLIVVGATLREAIDMTLIVEQTAMKLVTCHRLGKQPQVLPEDMVDLLKEIGPVG